MAEPFDAYSSWLSIPPAEQPPDHYRLLGVGRFEKRPEAVEAAARARLKRLDSHRQGAHAESCRRLLAEIAAARACLLDEKRRAAYDRSLRKVAGDGQPASQQTRPTSLSSLLDEELPPLAGPLDALMTDPALSAQAQSGSPLLAIPRKRSQFERLDSIRRLGGAAQWSGSPLTLVGGGVLAALLVFGAWLLWTLTRPTAEASFAEANREYEAGRYASAIEAFDAFLRRFPEHSEAGQARVRRGLSQLAAATEGQPDWRQAYHTALAVVDETGGEPTFAAEAPPKLAVSLTALAKALAAQAREKRDPDLVRQGWEILDLVEKHLGDVDLQDQRLDKVELTLGLAAREIAGGASERPAILRAPQRAETLAAKDAEQPSPRAGDCPPFRVDEKGTVPLDARAAPDKPPQPGVAANQPADGAAPAEEPLYEQDPFDQVVLSQQEGGKVLKIVRLTPAERKVPDNVKPADKLTLRLLDQSDKTYEVLWSAIERVEPFEQVLLGKANELVAAGRLPEAFGYLEFLEANHPALPGLAKAVEECLYEQAKASQRRHDYRDALATLCEVYRVNPKRSGLDKALGAATDGLIQQAMAAEQEPAARQLARNLAACFPGHPLAAAWEERWKQQAAGLLLEARAVAASGDLRRAAAVCRRIERTWPATAGAMDLARSIHEKHARVVVGVLDSAAVPEGGGKEPKEIVERHFTDAAEAVRALRYGRIDVLDRVPPRDLEKLRADRRIAVQPYALPLIHCLVPNWRRPLLAQRTFRRALVYALPRQAILEHLLAGAKSPGCRPISGPFAANLAGSDTPGQAGDTGVEPLSYDPQLALALIEAARHDAAAVEGPASTQRPALVLAHPAGEIAVAACAEIRRQLELVGLEVRLRQTPAPLPRVPEDCDLLYVEAAVRAPAADAGKLLGDEGPAGCCSPAMALALRRLGAADPSRVAQRLHELHRLVNDEVTVVPLWQWVDHFAYRADLQGIAKSTAVLYQDVERWKVPFSWRQ